MGLVGLMSRATVAQDPSQPCFGEDEEKAEKAEVKS